MQKVIMLGLLLALSGSSARADDTVPAAGSATPSAATDGTGAAMPHHHRGGGAGKGMGAISHAGSGHAIGAKLKQVLTLQSLTVDQRKQIRDILTALKQETGPLKEQLKAAGGGAHGAGASTAAAGAGAADTASGGAGAAGGAAAAGGADTQALRKQFRQKQIAAWTKIKGVLSEAQLAELDQSNSGALVHQKGAAAGAGAGTGAGAGAGAGAGTN